MTKNEGIIFNIQRFSIHDGPGIRILFFMKGCPLRCLWCSNPEAYNMKRDILSDIRKCINCGKCMAVCPNGAIKFDENRRFHINRDQCNNCGLCCDICPTNSKRVCGENYSIEELMEIVEKESAFVNQSMGGITVGGGELMMQVDFVAEFLKECKKRNIDTAIETSGFAKWEYIEKIIKYCDTVFFDIKALDAIKHKKITGFSNDIILENIKKLTNMNSDQKIRIILRIPIISGINDSYEEISELAKFISAELKFYDQIELLPFHNFGEQKYMWLDKEYLFAGKSNMKGSDLHQIAKIFKDYDINVCIHEH